MMALIKMDPCPFALPEILTVAHMRIVLKWGEYGSLMLGVPWYFPHLGAVT